MRTSGRASGDSEWVLLSLLEMCHRPVQDHCDGLRVRRATSIAVAREAVIPTVVAPAVVIGISVIEILLATALMRGAARPATGIAAAALFAAFGTYCLAVAARTKSLTCACSGRINVSAATPRAVAAAATTSVIQVGLALT